MKDLTNIGYVLRVDGVPWMNYESSYVEVNEIPPAPPWIKRTKRTTPWREYDWSVRTAPAVFAFIVGAITVLVSIGIAFTIPPWGLIAVPLSILISLAPLFHVNKKIKKNTKLYEIHDRHSRHYAEVTFMKNRNMRARVIVTDEPIRIEL